MEQQTEQKTKSNRKYAYACCAVSCGVLSGFVVFLLIVCIYAVIYNTEFGENKAACPFIKVEKGSNFCYYIHNRFLFPQRYLEFTISERDFLDWGKSQWDKSPDGNQWWNPVEIKCLPSLPKPNVDRENGSACVVNGRQGGEIPLSIPRYICKKEAHQGCYPWKGLCLNSPAGKADNSCIRFIEDGYYFEIWAPRRCYAGIYVLYDRENQRCYYAYASN